MQEAQGSITEYVIPLTKNYKPLKSWPDQSTTDPAKIDRWRQEGFTNFGIDTGKSGLIVVDLDVKNGKDGIKSWQELCAKHGGCPETYTVKTKSGGQHLYFRGQTRSSTSAHNGLGAGIDIRSKGGFVICPPSAGYAIIKDAQVKQAPQWLLDLLPLPKPDKPRDDSDKQIVAKDDPVDVERAVEALHNVPPPEPGNRNEELYRRACSMRDKGISEEKIAEILDAYIEENKLEQSGKDIAHHAYQYAAGKVGSTSVTEFKVLEPPEQDKKHKKKTRKKKDEEDEIDIVNDPSPTLLKRMEQMNDEWCTVLGDGRLLIMRKDTDARGYAYYRDYIRRDFIDYYENEEVEIMTPDGPKARNVAKVWLAWIKRRNYSRGRIFDPTGKQEPDTLNTWLGFATEPVEGDWSLLRNHIWESIAMSEGPEHADEYFNYIMNWLAHVIQQPEDLPGVALVLRGGKGCGKSIIGEQMAKIIGAHGQNGSGGQHLTTQFNAYMEDCIFCIVNEITWANNKEGQELLKDRITSEILRVEPKGKDVRFVKNYMHLMITSNASWVIPATPDERRYAVFDVLPTHQKDDEFWNKVVYQMNNGGREAMYYELKNRPLGNWKPRKNIPRTNALMEQITGSRNSAQQFLADMIDAGEIPQAWQHPSIQNGDWKYNPQMVLRDEMASAFMLKAGLKNLQSATVKLGNELKKMKAQERYPELQTRQLVGGTRMRFHILPPLSDPVWNELKGQ